MQLTLFHYWRSSCSWRLRWALALKNVPYESRPINLLENEHKQPEYLKLNPNGAVPTLLIDGVPFGQSMALIEWLDETFPSPPLLPNDAIQRLKVRELAQTITADTQPLQNLRVMNLHSSDPSQRKTWAAHWIRAGLSAFEARLTSAPQGKFCYGNSISLADLALVPQCYNAERFAVGLKEFPRCESIYRHALTTPACDQAAPHNQPGAVP